MKTPAEYRENLEVTAEHLNQIQLAHLYQLLQWQSEQRSGKSLTLI